MPPKTQNTGNVFTIRLDARGRATLRRGILYGADGAAIDAPTFICQQDRQGTPGLLTRASRTKDGQWDTGRHRFVAAHLCGDGEESPYAWVLIVEEGAPSALARLSVLESGPGLIQILVLDRDFAAHFLALAPPTAAKAPTRRAQPELRLVTDDDVPAAQPKRIVYYATLARGDGDVVLRCIDEAELAALHERARTWLACQLADASDPVPLSKHPPEPL